MDAIQGRPGPPPSSSARPRAVLPLHAALAAGQVRVGRRQRIDAHQHIDREVEVWQEAVEKKQLSSRGMMPRGGNGSPPPAPAAALLLDMLAWGK